MNLAGMLPSTTPPGWLFPALGAVCVITGCALFGLVLAGIAWLALHRLPSWARKASTGLMFTAGTGTGVLMLTIALAGGRW